MQSVKPKKALGQHFLIDLGIAENIARTLDDYAGTPVLEVGPGMGVLTQFLLNKHEQNLKVVEIDDESVTYLAKNFPQLNGKVIAEDFLTLNLDEIFNSAEKICVIGNYPYNISSQIFFKVLDYRDLVVCCSGMLQKEVAERIAAKPGSKTYGILSVLLQAWYDIEYLFTVPEHVFNPPPKVKSGVIRLTRNAITDLGCNERLFKTIVKTSFGQRRKTLRNSMRGFFEKGSTVLEDPIFNKRPEQLSVDEFISLTNLVEQNQPK